MSASSSKLPDGPFAAFSTAKMSYFLPITAKTDQSELDAFFGQDTSHVHLTQGSTGPMVTLEFPGSKPQVAYTGNIIVGFTNGKYKVIDETYYHQNFYDPIVDKNEHGFAFRGVSHD